MTKIKIINQNKEVLEEFDLRSDPQRFLLYRGRLLEWVQVEPDEYLYMERQYLEIY